MGGKAASEVIQGERQFDLLVRMQEPFRKDGEAIKNLLIATPNGQHLPLSQFADIRVNNGASFIYREANSRFIGVQFSVRNRDLAGAVEEARRAVDKQVKLPTGYTFDWGGEYKDYLAAREQMKIIAPLTVLLILLILFALYGNLKFPLIILFSVLVTEPVGGLLALWYTKTNFSVSSGLGFVALMGVAVLTSVILYSFINKLRLEGNDIITATYQASLLRLRPIMMTALVACIGLLPAATSTGIGSDSQKPFAIVIVGGLLSRLFLSIFLSPILVRSGRARRRRAEGLKLTPAGGPVCFTMTMSPRRTRRYRFAAGGSARPLELSAEDIPAAIFAVKIGVHVADRASGVDDIVCIRCQRYRNLPVHHLGMNIAADTRNVDSAVIVIDRQL